MRPEIRPIRAFLYARSATEDQNAPTARADEQLQRLRQQAQSRSYVVVGEARDATQSGTSLSRNSLTSVLRQAACEPATFDVLLTVDRTRLARSPDMFQAIESRLLGAGIHIEFADEAPVRGGRGRRAGKRVCNVPTTINLKHGRSS